MIKETRATSGYLDHKGPLDQLDHVATSAKMGQSDNQEILDLWDRKDEGEI